MASIYDSLKQDLKAGKVIVPGDADYDDSIKRWSASCIQQAAAVIKPTSAAEVSTAILWANKHALPFTVCGGGHSTSGQSSKGPEGVVIDLSLLCDVQVDPAAQTITYGGGCLWSDVDAAAAQHGLATPGGTVNHTGVGGLILGGGFGFLSPRHGLTIDVLLEAEAVLADGSVVTASETQNQDLFWALRGAGASFAAVTRFTSRAFPQGDDVWAGVLVFSPDQLAEVVAGCNEVLAGQDGDQAMLLAFTYSPPPDRARVIIAQVFHNGSADEGEARYAPLLRVGPRVNAVQTVPYTAVNGLANAGVPHGGRYQFGAANVTFPVDVGVVQAAAKVWWEGIERFSVDPGREDLRGSMIGYELFPNDKAREVDPRATAFANRGRYFNVAVLMSWKNAETDGRVRSFKQEVAALIRDKGFKGDEVGGEGVGQYNNYLDSSISAEGAFGSNAKRLKELKQKYDPENRFDKLWKLV